MADLRGFDTEQLPVARDRGVEVLHVERDVERVLGHAVTSIGWRRSATGRPGAAVENELPQAVDGAPAALDVEPVDTLAPLPLADEEPGVGQHLQMMRHRRAREREARGELPDVQPLARE